MSEDAWESTTVRWACPEGDVYVTMAVNGDPWPARIWLTVGKAGTELYAAGDALSAITRLALTAGVPRRSVIKYLRGISNVEYNRLVHEASSMADALGRTLEMLYETPVEA